jgi:maleate isomerase
MCTNLRGAPVAPGLAAELGIPVLDSVAATIAHCLGRLG